MGIPFITATWISNFYYLPCATLAFILSSQLPGTFTFVHYLYSFYYLPWSTFTFIHYLDSFRFLAVVDQFFNTFSPVFTRFSPAFNQCYTIVSKVYQKCYKNVSKEFQSCLFALKSSQLPKHKESLLAFKSRQQWLKGHNHSFKKTTFFPVKNSIFLYYLYPALTLFILQSSVLIL